MLNKWLTISFLVLISTQLLPLIEVGSMLYGNQIVEEVLQSTDMDEKNSEGNEDLKKNEFYFHPRGFQYTVVEQTNPKVQAYCFEYASRLSDDTPTRPPLYVIG
ncbi:MAG: hypothetical protein RJB03_913 [Bacteroidota bacterium]|jgi:hypothetical protein